MDQPRADIIKNVLYSDGLYFLHSGNNFSILILWKILLLLRFFFFYFRKISISLTRILGLFPFFFFRKILVPFTCFFLKLFFVFFIIVICHFYIQKKDLKNYFISFFICFKKSFYHISCVNYICIFMNHFSLIA